MNGGKGPYDYWGLREGLATVAGLMLRSPLRGVLVVSATLGWVHLAVPEPAVIRRFAGVALVEHVKQVFPALQPQVS